MKKQHTKLKFDSSLLFLSVSLVLVLSIILVYFFVKKFVFNSPTGIFVATPSGVATLTVSPAGTVTMAPSETKTFSVVINGIPSGKTISAIGFSLKVTGATVSNPVIPATLNTSAQAKQFELNGLNLNYAVASSYTKPLSVANGQTIATFDLTAPASAGSYSNVLVNVATSALPSIIDSTGVEIMKSDTSLLPINLTVTTPALANPTFNVTTDTVYNTSVSVSIDVPNTTGETIKYCTTTSNTTPCTPSISVTPGTAFTFTNTTPVYLYAQADKAGYTSSKAYSPKLTLNDTPKITSLTIANQSGVTGQNFTAGDNLTITAGGVSDAINGVTKVVFYKDTSVLGEDTTTPYSFTYNSAVIGGSTIKAEVQDAYNAKASLSTAITVKPMKPTFTPNGGTSASSISVTINNPNSGSTGAIIKYSLCDNCAPITTYSVPVVVSTSNKITANVTINGIVSDNAVSTQYTITGKVAAPIFNPVQGAYHPAQLTSVALSSSTPSASIKYCSVNFTAATEASATCTPSTVYTSAITMPVNTNVKVIAKASLTNWTDSDTVIATYKVKGDVDTNNTVDVLDVIKTLKAVFDSTLINNLMDLNKKADGTYGDNKVDLLDVIEIINIIF